MIFDSTKVGFRFIDVISGKENKKYVPGELLKEKNIVTVFEIHTPKSDRTLLFDDKPSLDTVKRPVFDTVTANLG